MLGRFRTEELGTVSIELLVTFDWFLTSERYHVARLLWRAPQRPIELRTFVLLPGLFAKNSFKVAKRKIAEFVSVLRPEPFARVKGQRSNYAVNRPWIKTRREEFSLQRRGVVLPFYLAQLAGEF